MIKRFCEALKAEFDTRIKMAESSLNTCGKEAVSGIRAQRSAFLDAKAMIDELYRNFDPDDLDDEREDM